MKLVCSYPLLLLVLASVNPQLAAVAGVKTAKEREQERNERLIDQSEDLRQVNAEWRRFWFNGNPATLNPPGRSAAAPICHRISKCTK